MIINYIAKTYNSAKLLPYVFRHYDQFVTNYYIWDNLSTDGTKELILKNPKVTIFDLHSNTFDDYDHRNFKNNAWKDFKECDFIINADFDEFIYHPDLLNLLNDYKKEGIQIIKPEGYQMFSEQFPKSDKQIYEIIKTGIREQNYDKPIIFSPDIEPKFSFGAHFADVNANWTYSDIKLLHYKFIGQESIIELLNRNERLSERNKLEKLSLWPDEKGHRFNPYEVYESLKLKAIEVI